MDEILGYLGLAKRAGSLEYGEQTVSGAMLEKRAKLLILAQDASENTRGRAVHYAEETETVYITVPYTKSQLGEAIGKTSCAVLAVTDFGLAAAALRKLSEKTGQYEEENAAFQVRLEKSAQRKKVARSHKMKVSKGNSGRKKE